MQQNSINLSWSPKLFIKSSKKRSVVGFDVRALYKYAGRVRIIEGLCLLKRGKRNGLVCTSMVLRKKVGSCFMLVRFFIFFGSAFRYKVVGFSYKKKKINFSRISYARYS